MQGMDRVKILYTECRGGRGMENRVRGRNGAREKVPRHRASETILILDGATTNVIMAGGAEKRQRGLRAR